MSLPEDVKLKKYVKGLAKEAASICAVKHRERRAYMREQLKGLTALAGMEPGMLGPKLPMVKRKTEWLHRFIFFFTPGELGGST